MLFNFQTDKGRECGDDKGLPEVHPGVEWNCQGPATNVILILLTKVRFWNYKIIKNRSLVSLITYQDRVMARGDNRLTLKERVK